MLDVGSLLRLGTTGEPMKEERQGKLEQRPSVSALKLNLRLSAPEHANAYHCVLCNSCKCNGCKVRNIKFYYCLLGVADLIDELMSSGGKHNETGSKSLARSY